jgi:16S rRNA (guanine(527)-N(7))-methyltransferase RsmG
MESSLWASLAQTYTLSEHQINQLHIYWSELVAAHDEFNITTEIQEKSFIVRHVADSLAVTTLITPWNIHCLADVGSGGGFPGIPLAIVYPNMKVFLIEVNHKKIEFLRRVVDKIGLEHVEVCSLDWRTFLRKTQYPIELFCARASLAPDALLRLFKPSSAYRHSQLVYWASRLHEPSLLEQQYMRKSMPYTVGHRQRFLVLYGLTHDA